MNCRACQSDTIEFLNLGEQYLSDFRNDVIMPPKYPVVAMFCDKCKLVQLNESVPQSEMYHERYGFKSGVSDSIRKDLDDVVVHAFQYNNEPKRWLDIASNDGTLLSFVPKDIYRVGVDPVGFLCKEAEQHADLIINDYFSASSVSGKFDVITSISCFYDMPDPVKFVRDVLSVLDEKGVWIIQQNYLLETIKLSAVDNFSHEHLEYYTLLSLENLLDRFGLEVNEVRVSPINGGSIRTVISRNGTFDTLDSVYRQRQQEEDWALDNIGVYHDFAENIDRKLDNLNRLLTELKNDGHEICILGASTRGGTIWQSAGIDSSLISYAVERNPDKVGKNYCAVGVPIISEDEFRKRNPSYAVIGPWFFADEIIKREAEYMKRGGNFVLPLPEVEIYGKTSKTKPVLQP